MNRHRAYGSDVILVTSNVGKVKERLFLSLLF